MESRIGTFVDEADTAATRREWDEVAEKARAVLLLSAGSEDATSLLRRAEGMIGGTEETLNRQKEIDHALGC